jgi:DNA-binding transcriptional ArsR family regulator
MSLEEKRISELRATAHPLRLQMLSLLTGAELSAAEVARELGVTQANASYHLRLLESAGLLEVAGEESVRGGRAKKYRHPWDAPVARHEATRDADRLAYVRVLADMIPRRFLERQQGTPSRFTDADLWVEPEAWDRVCALVDEASTLLHASARPPRTEGTVRAALSVAAFRLRTEQDTDTDTDTATATDTEDES